MSLTWLYQEIEKKKQTLIGVGEKNEIKDFRPFLQGFFRIKK
jgi:hypothetical protein